MEALVECPHCRTLNRVRVRWPQSVERCVNPQCHRRLDVIFPEPCRYCGANVAEYSGDAHVAFPRCGACRKIHQMLDYLSLILKGSFVSVVVLTVVFFRNHEGVWIPWWILGIAGLFWLIGGRKLYGAIRVLDFLRNRVLKQAGSYYDLLYARVPPSLGLYLTILGLSFALMCLLAPSSFSSAFIPQPSSLSGKDSSTVAALLAIEGLLEWKDADIVAGLLGIAGLITLMDLLLVNGAPFLLRTRPCIWPRLDLKPPSGSKTTGSSPTVLKVGMTEREVEQVLGAPSLRPERRLLEEQVWIYEKRMKPAGLRRSTFPVFFKDGRLVRWGPQRVETPKELGRLAAKICAVLMLLAMTYYIAWHLKMEFAARVVREHAISLRPGLGKNEVQQALGEPNLAVEQREILTDPAAPLGHAISTWTYVRGFNYYFVPRYLILRFKDGYLTSWGSED